jgi:hypothetical protein
VKYRVNAESDTASAASQAAERQLWCAVLGRAFDDAMDRVTAVSTPGERLKKCLEARQWFVLNGMEFRTACEAAGYDPDSLRSRILPMIAGPAK